VVTPKLRIFATSKSDPDGVEEEITDLYWFEEGGVHDFGGEGNGDDYTFRFQIGDHDVGSLLERIAELEREKAQDVDERWDLVTFMMDSFPEQFPGLQDGRPLGGDPEKLHAKAQRLLGRYARLRTAAQAVVDDDALDGARPWDVAMQDKVDALGMRLRESS
jgi:hypothetical protein